MNYCDRGEGGGSCGIPTGGVDCGCASELQFLDRKLRKGFAIAERDHTIKYDKSQARRNADVPNKVRIVTPQEREEKEGRKADVTQLTTSHPS